MFRVSPTLPSEPSLMFSGAGSTLRISASSPPAERREDRVESGVSERERQTSSRHPMKVESGEMVTLNWEFKRQSLPNNAF